MPRLNGALYFRYLPSSFCDNMLTDWQSISLITDSCRQAKTGSCCRRRLSLTSASSNCRISQSLKRMLDKRISFCWWKWTQLILQQPVRIWQQLEGLWIGLTLICNVCVCVLTPCQWWSRGMKGCSSRQQPACRADAPRSRSSTCLWSYEAGSYASHLQPTETPGGTGKQEVTTIKRF